MGIRIQTPASAIQENYERLGQNGLLFDEKSKWVTFEKGLVKALANFFMPLYKRYEKEPKLSFEKSLLDFLKTQRIRATEHGLDEGAMVEIPDSNILISILSAVQEFGEVSVETIIGNNEKLDFFVLLLAGHLTLLKGKHISYYKLQQNFEKEVAFLMEHPIPDNIQKLCYQLQNLEEAKLDIKVESAKLYPNTSYVNTFCVIKANHVTLSKTPIFKNTREPKYNHADTFKIAGDVETETEIFVEIYDSDSEQLISSCLVKLEEIIENTFLNTTYRLRALLKLGKMDITQNEKERETGMFNKQGSQIVLDQLSLTKKASSVYDALLLQENVSGNFGELQLEFKIVLSPNSRGLVAKCLTSRISNLKELLEYNRKNLEVRRNKYLEVANIIPILKWDDQTGPDYPILPKARESSSCMCVFGKERELCMIF